MFPADLAGLAIAFVHPETGFNLRAPLGDLRFDAVDVAADVHAIGHGFLVVVFHHEVLLEETEGLLGRRGGEADERGVEIFQHLPPEIVDGAMALVRDDEIKFLDGKRGVVFHRNGLIEQCGRAVPALFVLWIQRRDAAATFCEDLRHGFQAFNRQVIEIGGGFRLAFEHGINALDRADDHAGGGVELIAAQALDDVFLGELVFVDRRNELLKFLERLVAEIAAIHEEQDAFRPGVFDEAIDEIDGGEGFARASGHLDEGARAAGSEGLLRFLMASNWAGQRLPCARGGNSWSRWASCFSCCTQASKVSGR